MGFSPSPVIMAKVPCCLRSFKRRPSVGQGDSGNSSALNLGRDGQDVGGKLRVHQGADLRASDAADQMTASVSRPFLLNLHGLSQSAARIALVQVSCANMQISHVIDNLRCLLRPPFCGSGPVYGHAGCSVWTTSHSRTFSTLYPAGRERNSM